METHILSAGFLLLTLFTHQQFYNLWDLADWWGQMLWTERNEAGTEEKTEKTNMNKLPVPPNRKQATPGLEEIHKPQTQKQKNPPTKQTVPSLPLL